MSSMSIDTASSVGSDGGGRADGVLAFNSDRYAASYVGPVERWEMVGSNAEAPILYTTVMSWMFNKRTRPCARATMCIRRECDENSGIHMARTDIMYMEARAQHIRFSLQSYRVPW